MTNPVKAIVGTLRRSAPALDTLWIEAETTTPWRSLLFDGARHHIRLGMTGDDSVAALRDVLETPEFAIIGHIVADIRLTSIDRMGEEALVSLEALTIEDRA